MDDTHVVGFNSGPSHNIYIICIIQDIMYSHLGWSSKFMLS